MPDRPSDENYDVLVEMMNISIQRQVTGENGIWNKEWEELGFKPLRQRGQKDGDKPAASASTDSDSDGGTEAAGSGASNALERLKAARGKAAAAPAEVVDASDDSPAEVAAAADDVTTTPEVSGETEVSDLAAKIKARVGKKSA